MTNNKNNLTANRHHEKNKAAWDAFHADYMKFNLQYRPDYYEYFKNGGVSLDKYIPELTGDVNELQLLDTCCACDASQTFSWTNLGAKVTACDISPEAIRIASDNAGMLNLDVKFIVADAQTLLPIANNSHDIVFATYLAWFQDINFAVKTWYRVLRNNGRLLIHVTHPYTECLEEKDGALNVSYNYDKNIPFQYDKFDGTGMSTKFGGWSVDLPVVEFNHRLSDIINAVLGAGFNIELFYESTGVEGDSQMSKLPEDMFLIARKQIKQKAIL